MDNRLKYAALLGLAGLGVYLIYKGEYLAKWFPELFGPAAGAADKVTAAAAAAAEAARLKAAQAAAAAASDPTNAAKAAEARRLLDAAAAAEKTRLEAAAAAEKKRLADAAAAAAKPPAVNCTSEQRLCADGSPMGRAADCTWLPASCPPFTPYSPPAYVLSRDERVAAAAAAAGAPTLLNMDEWNFYAGQLGFPQPDPGAIPLEIYAGAFYADTDRTTPIDVGTWSALVDWAAGNPGSLSGLGGRQLMGLGWAA